MQLLSTKISTPPLRSKLVDRQRLFHMLDQSLDTGFALISAPAGYGKSTLLSAWLRQRRVPSAWLSLDEGDNDSARFLAYLASALRKVAPLAAEALESSLQTSSYLGADTFLTPFLNSLAQTVSPFFLVLDDYHLILSQEIHRAIGFLIENRPEPFHLAIATRADPPLPLARLRARSQMVELRLADLRFSSAETEEFLNQVIGLNLSEEELALLQTSTEGWAAGLQMAGLSLQGRENTSDFIRSFSGENRYILDFLFEEVFQRQPEDTRAFLLQTAILDRLSGPLCDALLQREGSQAMLETLARKNLFLIALDEQREWYRYHYLFRDLLKSHLGKTYADALASLHLRASNWFAAAHDLEHAIYHALAASDYEKAACLIEENIHALDKQNQQALLTTWMHHIPDEILKSHPWLCVFRAWGDYWSGNRGAEESWLLCAEQAIETHFEATPQERQRIQGQIACVRAHLAIEEENPARTLEIAQKALDLLPGDDDNIGEIAIAMGAAYWALGDAAQSERAFSIPKVINLEKIRPIMTVGPACYAGIQQFKQGRLQDALNTFLHGLSLATMPDGRQTPIAGFPNVKIGDLWREWNDLVKAEPYLAQGVSQCMQFGQPDVLMDALICLGRFQLAQGEMEKVEETLQKAQHLIHRTRQIDPFLLTWLEELRLKAWLSANELEVANRWARTSGLKLDDPVNYISDLAHQNLARLLVAQALQGGLHSSAELARPLLARLVSAAEKAGWVYEVIKFSILQALNEDALENEELALQNLARSLSLAEPGGFVRVFLDEGKAMHRLLQKLDNGLPAGGNSPYLARLLASFQDSQGTLTPAGSFPAPGLAGKQDPGLAHAGSPLVEPLTGREMDVLRLLAQGCSDKQIAQKLVIAPETVHKHLKNIYGKLDVHSRIEALVRARELGLV